MIYKYLYGLNNTASPESAWATDTKEGIRAKLLQTDQKTTNKIKFDESFTNIFCS